MVVAVFSCLALFGCNKTPHAFGIHAPGASVPGSACEGVLTCDPAADVADEAADFAVCTTEGHTVRFACKEGKWTAKATENLPDGFSNVVDLPIDCADGISVESIAKGTPEFQKRYVRVNFRPSCSDSKRHVYIGQIGLHGGGARVSTCPSTDRLATPESIALEDRLDIPGSIALTAEDQIGSMLWACEERRGFFAPNTCKCHLFVAEVLAAVGARAGGIPSSSSSIGQILERPLLAKDWADSSCTINNWEIVNSPKRGDVVAEAARNAAEGDDDSGHVGIVVAASDFGDDGASVSSAAGEGGRIVRNAFGFRPSEDPVFRRYVGSQWALIDSIGRGNW